jgi:hypothetical protein
VDPSALSYSSFCCGGISVLLKIVRGWSPVGQQYVTFASVVLSGASHVFIYSNLLRDDIIEKEASGKKTKSGYCSTK